MDATNIYEIFRDITIVHSNEQEWRSLHCFGVGYLSDLNTDNLEQADFRKEYFYSEKWNESGKDPNKVTLDFPMCLMEPPVCMGEIERDGKKLGDKIFKCTIYVADLYGYDRQNNDTSTYAKRTREAIWRDTHLMGEQILKEFNRIGWEAKPKFSIANNGKFETDSLFDVANKRLVITLFDFSIILPSGCIDGTSLYPPPQPPTPSIPTGSLAVWSGTRWEPLKQGEAGTLLKSNGVGNLPEWVDFEADETDPLFNAWLATNPIPVIPTNISAFLNDVGYITEAPQDGKQYARQNATWNEVLSSGGAGVITRVLTADVVNTSQTPAEIIGLSFEADPNSTYIITGGLNILYAVGAEAYVGMIIPSGSLSCTFIGKKNSSYDSMFSYMTGGVVVVTRSNREGHVGVYAVVTTGATGGTVMFRHVNFGANGTVATKAKSFIKAIKVV